jgi:bacillithiol synthase
VTSLRFEQVNPQAALFLALLRGDRRVVGLLGGAADDDSAPLRAAETAADRDIDRSALSATLTQRMQALGAPPAALRAAARIAEPRSVVVVAGQQPVLFGGPHLVISKALAAVALCRRIEREVGVPAVPVFWSASEDHDQAEVDHVSLPNGDVLRTPLPGDRRMLSHLELPDSVAEIVAGLTGALPAGPGRDDVLSAVDPAGSATWGDWVARTLLRLLGRFGLVLVEPAALRPAAAGVLTHEFAHPGALARSVAQVEAGFELRGFDPPLGLTRDELFFRVTDGRRARVPVTSGLQDELARAPESFSWNVVTRVLAQNLALPVAAQVCGPSELAYVAAMVGAHMDLGLSLPALVPRPGVTIVEPSVRRALAGLGVPPEAVVADGAAGFPDSLFPEPEGLLELRRAADSLPESDAAAIRRKREAVHKAVRLYGEALEREAAARTETTAARRAKALAALRPGDQLQERTCSPLPWIARYGPGLLDRWLAAVAGPGVEHVVLAAQPSPED